MDEMLTQLATSGAQTIVRLMATDLWQSMRDGVIRIFSHKGHREIESVVEELETSRNRVTNAELSSRSTVEQQEQDRWEARVRLCLVDEPEIASLIQQLIETAKAAGVTSAANLGTISLHGSAYDNARVYQQGSGTQYNA